MPSTKNWWAGAIDWTTPAGQLLQKFLATLPRDRPFRFTLYGSAPLQLTVDRQLMSGDVDLFSDDDEDLSALSPDS
jgi:predicted nucleotidyltransferase